MAFQPHRYTRTRDLMREFGLALAAADEVVLTDIYAASEDPIPGITIEALAAAINTSRATPVYRRGARRRSPWRWPIWRAPAIS